MSVPSPTVQFESLDLDFSELLSVCQALTEIRRCLVVTLELVCCSNSLLSIT